MINLFESPVEIKLTQIDDLFAQWIAYGQTNISGYVPANTLQRWSRQFKDGWWSVYIITIAEKYGRVYLPELFAKMQEYLNKGYGPKRWRKLVNNALVEKARSELQREMFRQGYLQSNHIYGLFGYRTSVQYGEFLVADRRNIYKVEDVYARISSLTVRPRSITRAQGLISGYPLLGRVFEDYSQNNLMWEDVQQTEKPYVFKDDFLSDALHVVLNYLSDERYYVGVRMEREEHLKVAIDKMESSYNTY